MKKFTRAACRSLFPVRYKALSQLLNLMGRWIKKCLIGKFVVVKDLRLSCVVNVTNVTFNNKSDFTQLVNLRSRWRLKRFRCPVTKVKEIMGFDWSLTINDFNF